MRRNRRVGCVRAALRIDAAREVVSIDRPGFGTEELPLDAADVIRIIVDADILEVFSGCYGAYRMLPADDAAATTIVVDGAGDDDVVIRPLRVG